MTRKKKGHIGSSFEEFLRDEGAYEETTAVAVKRVLAWQLEQAMEENKISKNRMAKEMKTSRSQLDRILDPENTAVRFDTVIKAARVLGRQVRIDLI